MRHGRAEGTAVPHSRGEHPGVKQPGQGLLSQDQDPRHWTQAQRSPLCPLPTCPSLGRGMPLGRLPMAGRGRVQDSEAKLKGAKLKGAPPSLKIQNNMQMQYLKKNKVKINAKNP